MGDRHRAIPNFINCEDGFKILIRPLTRTHGIVGIAVKFPFLERINVILHWERLVALVLVTAMQILHLQPALAYPIHQPPPQSSDSVRNTQKAVTGASIEMLSDTQGVDFDPFMQSVYRSVKREWFAGMPPSIEKGEKGIVSIEFPAGWKSAC